MVSTSRPRCWTGHGRWAFIGGSRRKMFERRPSRQLPTTWRCAHWSTNTCPSCEGSTRRRVGCCVPDGVFVVVGYHPYFIMAAGMPTHFDGPEGHPVAIETYV